MIIPPGEKGEVDQAAIDSALEKAKKASGLDAPSWDAETLVNVVLVNKAFMDPMTGQRVWTATRAIPALDMTTGRVSYKEFILIFLNLDEQTPEVLERCLVYELLRGLANRRMLVDEGIPPIPGFIEQMVHGQMHDAFGESFNDHPIPESQGGPPIQHPSSREEATPPRHQHSSHRQDQLRAVQPIPYTVGSELKA